MDSRTCCSVRDEVNSYQCSWNCDRELNCDLMLKTNAPVRRKREFTPDEQKDDHYWLKRSRNNEAARRSRERRRTEERLLEARTTQLIRENQKLKAALTAFNYHGVNGAMMKHQVRDLSGNSYLGSWADFPASASVPRTSPKSLSCALSSGCDFNSVYKSEIEGFSTASYMRPVQDTIHPRDSYVSGNLGIHLPINNPAVYSHHNPASFTVSEILTDQEQYYTNRNRKTEYQGHLAGAALHDLSMDKFAFSRSGLEFHKDCFCRGCKKSCYIPPHRCTQIMLDESYAEEGPIIKAKEMSKTVTETGCVSTLPLLPHKLRYKANKKQHGEDLSSS